MFRLPIIFFLTLFWLTPALAVLADHPYPDHGTAIPLAGAFSILRDAEGRLDIQDVAAPSRADDFKPLPGDFSTRFTQDTIWLRFSASRTSTTPSEWLLEIRPAFLDQLMLYAPNQRGGFDALDLGDQVPFSTRPVEHHYATFPISLDEAKRTYYLKLRTTSNMMLQARLWRTDDFQRHQNADYLLLGLFHGMIGIMAVFNLIFWIWLRDPLHLRYAAYIASMSLLQFGISGLLAQWVFPDNPVAVDRSTGVLLCLQMAMVALFLNTAFRFNTLLPRLARVFSLCVVYYTAVAILAAAGYYPALAELTTTFALIQIIASLIAALWLTRQHEDLRLMAFAFFMLLAAGLAMFLRNLGLLQLGANPDQLITIGTLLHVILLNFTLARRVRNTEQKSLELARAGERQLEDRVIERTRELAQANLALSHEVTERMHLEQRLQAALADTQQALKTQRKFVALVSHEFRTPLAIIDTTSQTLSMATAPTERDTHRRLGYIRNAVANLSGLLETCLADERLETRCFAPRLTTTKLRPLVNDLVERFSAGHNLVIEISESSAKEIHLTCDVEMTSIALTNLLDNAVKYSVAPAQISVNIGTDEKYTWIEVVDQGLGIAESDLPHIFEKFSRGRNHEGGASGTGLGLYLVRSILEAHGGEVHLDSRLGEGSRFRLNFPRTQLEESDDYHPEPGHTQ